MDSIQLTLPFAPDEQWLDIPGYDGIYQVSNFGNVRRIIVKDSIRRERMLSVTGRSRGYPIVGLTLNGVQKVCRVHRLVMLAFESECPAGMVVNHKNGNKLDNRLINLEYVTYSENIRHACNLNRHNTGANHHLTKLNEDMVREMRELYAGGQTKQVDIAKQYGITQASLSYILNRKSWKHVE